MDGMVVNGNTGADPRIALVGVGGAGCNVIDMLHRNACAADTIAINTDKESMGRISAGKKLYICKGVLKGQGARGDADVGRNCADAHRAEIEKALEGYDFVFVFAGLGGGTGSGATPVVLNYAKALGAHTYTIAINPFFFEGPRKKVASSAYQMIKGMCPDTMLIDNDLVLRNMPHLTADEAYKEVNRSIARYIDICISTIHDNIRVEMGKMGSTSYDGYDVPEEFPLANIISA